MISYISNEDNRDVRFIQLLLQIQYKITRFILKRTENLGSKGGITLTPGI